MCCVVFAYNGIKIKGQTVSMPHVPLRHICLSSCFTALYVLH